MINTLGMDVPDRPFVTSDDTTGPRRGTVYSYGVENGAIQIAESKQKRNGMYVYRSNDRFKTYQRSAIVTDGSEYTLFNSQGVVMPNGAYGILYGILPNESAANVNAVHSSSPNAKVVFTWSNDGGKTFTKPVFVSDWYQRFGAMLMGMPALAVDRTNGPFRGRLYAAWIDVRTGSGEIRFARSSDGGKTWSPSYVISDNWARDSSGVPRQAQDDSPDAFMPELAVNKNGVVGATWYDRRDHPDNLGYDIRFSASTDGGETFSPGALISAGGGSAVQMPSTTLSGFENAFSWPIAQGRAAGRLHAEFGWSWDDNGGDTAGLVASPDGVFHPLWIDRRLGLQQLFTSRVTVNAVAQANGGAGLQSLRDLSEAADVRYAPPQVDNASHVITIGAVIRNRSRSPLPGDLKLRLVGLGFVEGPVTVQNADNGGAGVGAVWDFHTASGKALEPGALSDARELQFHVRDWPIARGPLSGAHSGLIEMDMKVLGP